MNTEARASLVHRVARRRGVRQFVKFGIVGASGFIVNLAVFTLLQKYMEHHAPLTAPASYYYYNFSLGFLAGGISNYFLNRAWTFRATGHAVVQGLQFITVSGLALLVGLGVSRLVEPSFGHGHKTWFLATVSGIVVNFFLNKYWTFRTD